MFLIFDTETTGFAKVRDAHYTNLDAWSTARMVQIAWQLHDEKGKLIYRKNYIIKPDGFEIPYAAIKIHGISHERAMNEGVDVKIALEDFHNALQKAKYIVGHNLSYDVGVTGSEFVRLGMTEPLVAKMKVLDTQLLSTNYCALPGGKGGGFKWPKLEELHKVLYGKFFDAAHDASYDVDATAKCFFELVKRNVIKVDEIINLDELIYEAPVLEAANFSKTEKKQEEISIPNEIQNEVIESEFTHLHVHSQHSILQSTSDIGSIIKVAKELKMSAIALTDHGNMMGAFVFNKKALAAGIKPIIGCEFYLCKNRLNKSEKDDGYQIVLLAKNRKGYQNLIKLASIAYTEGFYYVPRIDREILLQYKSDIIVLSGGLWGEIPNLILNQGESAAEEKLYWWMEYFADDFYLEINRHGIEEENYVNQVLLKFSKKHDLKCVAANNTYYSHKSDATSHDILLCVKDAAPVSQPKKYYGKRGREYRFGFPNDEFYIKSSDEMKQLFSDLPEAIENTQEIAAKCEEYKLEREVLLPKFDIPEEFQDVEDLKDNGKRGENNYLRYLTYEGAKKRYKDITPEIKERIDFELNTVSTSGYSGYFLIVQDFCNEARKMDVSVGPGRGSAAGSVVAYCIGVTNIDPIKYNLLFERFLNPERVSMPDIDIDFDDEGRQKVIDYVIKKYGLNQVAQIMTYGTMASKSSIRDAGRVLELPLQDTDKMAKLVPLLSQEETLNEVFTYDDKTLKEKLRTDDIAQINQLKKIAEGNGLESKVINQALALEGSIRNTGIHACGVIITPDDITNFVPVALAKDSEMYCTQFDSNVVEGAGLLKMDFLGLKTLTLIKDACRIIKERHGIDLDPDAFPLDDEKTYQLFQKGETVGIFQYESPGMQKHLKDLKPTDFSDLIAMNALYRPGPMDYIPSFINRKHGREKIEYDIEEQKIYLEETYGITVYQEQVMLLSQTLAGFTKGEADVLRKAMGKKQKDVLDKMRPKFIEQATERGHSTIKLAKIWKDWEKFASYAFNKSHSTCYAYLAYQTAYLKAHYPAEYMASVLSNNMNDIKSVTFFMEECRRMGVQVLGPDVNESRGHFFVNKDSQIRFGLNGIKGTGSIAVDDIVNERDKNGAYKDFWNFVSRVNLRTVNKKTLESLAYAGAFDSFAYHRAQYFENSDGSTLIEKAIKYGGNYKTQQESAQASLFGGTANSVLFVPKVADCEKWSSLHQFKLEKEVVGIYISGHPLDQYKMEIAHFTKGKISDLSMLDVSIGKEFRLAGIVTNAEHKMTKNGKPFGSFDLEDYDDSFRFMLFGDDYAKFKGFMEKDWFLLVQGRVMQKSWRDKNSGQETKRTEFIISSINLLADVIEKLAKGILLRTDVKDISKDFITEVERLAEEHKGKKNLKFTISDTENNIEVEMLSRKHRVDLSKDFFDAVERVEGATIKLY